MSGRLMRRTAPLGLAVAMFVLAACSAQPGDTTTPPETPEATVEASAGPSPVPYPDGIPDVMANPVWRPVPVGEKVLGACWSRDAGLTAVLTVNGDNLNLTGIDLVDNRIVWTTTVVTLSEDADRTLPGNLDCDNAGHAVVLQSGAFVGEDSVTNFFVVDMTDGAVKGQLGVKGLVIQFLVGDKVVIQTGDLITAYAIDDIATPVWENSSGAMDMPIGDDYVVLQWGVVRADTGEPAGFGDDASKYGVNYTGSGAGHVIRKELVPDPVTGESGCTATYQAWDTATNSPIWTVTGMAGSFSYVDETFYLLSGIDAVSHGGVCVVSAGSPTMTAYSLVDGSQLWSMQLPEMPGGMVSPQLNDTDPQSGSPRAATAVAYEVDAPDLGQPKTALVDLKGRSAIGVDGAIMGFGSQVAYISTGRMWEDTGQAGYDMRSLSSGRLWATDTPDMGGSRLWVRQIGPWLLAYPVPATGDGTGMSVLVQQ